jgi:hypothetical protein
MLAKQVSATVVLRENLRKERRFSFSGAELMELLSVEVTWDGSLGGV